MWKAVKWTALIALLVAQFLNHTGFCYRDMTYYSEIEIEKMARARARPPGSVDHFHTSWGLNSYNGVIARSLGTYYGTFSASFHNVKPNEPMVREGPIDACGDVPRWWN